jgi:hypothetical protein
LPVPVTQALARTDCDLFFGILGFLSPRWRVGVIGVIDHNAARASAESLFG